MLKVIIIMRKRRAGVLWRINIYTFDLAREFLFQRLKRRQVVTKDQAVIKNIIFTDSTRGTVRLARVLNQYARLQLGPIFLADPGEFKFSLMIGHR